ncbi:pyridoxal phosphate phosphatase phospho2 [Plakobranchus ocellatus]|uniref:Pyridoxal phosphate phosphatase phospho2 n=1 Tax=Plakobranchus ocellatus TaxID=259542 RepID=A0AAV4CUX5_9GAST|nr:pyridoxal phosphate phosphatase phospho2 [Plakobranchus ocellatus]
MARYLIVFDFDHSLIDENSDLYVIKLAPNGKLPKEIEGLYEDSGWMDYMSEIFKYLHKNGIQSQDILKCMSEIPLTPGMKELLNFTGNTKCFDHIIISDSNSVFINQILETYSLSSVINHIFTNPAKFDDVGCLTLEGYHAQDWCSLSTVNMCKGHILKDFLKKKQESGTDYAAILYVGDGYNDLCPSLTLQPQDYIFPRVGFRLNKLISQMSKENMPVERSSLKASVIPWESGLNILETVKSFSLN